MKQVTGLTPNASANVLFTLLVLVYAVKCLNPSNTKKTGQINDLSTANTPAQKPTACDRKKIMEPIIPNPYTAPQDDPPFISFFML